MEKRLSERLRRHPYEREDAATNYQRLTFCDIMDYAQIVLKNWQVFEGAFGSRGEVERHFLNLKEYRNALKHAREMNAVERKQGEASVEWLFRILERARQVAALSEGGLAPAEALEPNGQGESDEENGDNNASTSTVETLLAKTVDPQALERIKEMMHFCEALPDVERYVTRHHIVYRTNRAFAKIFPQRLQFWVDVIREGVADPHNLLKHKDPVHGHIEVPNELDLQKVKDLVQQSYNRTTVSAEVEAK